MDLAKLLNDKQLEGATSDSQYLRIIAGAGSGKTRVLTYRIAYLIGERFVNPSRILGITFTNKAAKEIKERVEKILPEINVRDLCTIHSWCARFLRREALHIDYPRSFKILDDDDRLSIFKEIFSNLGRLKSDPELSRSMNWIGARKTEGLQYEDIKDEKYPNPTHNFYLSIYEKYTKILKERASLDFDDLLLKTIEILEKNPDVQQKYSRIYSHILVDEFQDINDVQFVLIKLLMNKNTSLYVVGDPDQTIYTWRGANNKIIINLEKSLKEINEDAEVKTIILNQNYRSTQNILDTANRLIQYNDDRVKKDLFSKNERGDKVSFFCARTGKEEASYVASTIMDLNHKENIPYKEIAVLYRANYLTRELETELNMRRIKYRIYGGQKFFQRKEIKDVLAYLSLIVNQLDDTSFIRIINVPKRNIGPTSIDRIKQGASEAGQTLYLYLKESLMLTGLQIKSKESLKKMFAGLDELSVSLNSRSKDCFVKMQEYFANIGYFSYLDEDDNGDERKENVMELLQSISDFLLSSQDATLLDFMENAALQAAQDEVKDGDFLSLMTAHTAKGLEFNYVFVYGFSDGVFPSARSVIESKRGLEEERRLAYVAFTRAKKRLYVSSNQDYNYTLGSNMRPSRFIKEAGIEYEEKHNSYDIFVKKPSVMFNNNQFNKSVLNQTSTIQKQPVNRSNGIKDWKVGDRVSHTVYGGGTVLEVRDRLIVVQFDNIAVGKKTMLSTHPTITRTN